MLTAIVWVMTDQIQQGDTVKWVEGERPMSGMVQSVMPNGKIDVQTLPDGKVHTVDLKDVTLVTKGTL